MIEKRITSGEMTFIEFEKELGHIYREDYERMREELKTLGVVDKTARKRLDQLKKFRQLNICAKGAKVILKFAKEFGLTGNFQQIQIIASVRSTLKIYQKEIKFKKCNHWYNLTFHH